MKFKLVHIFEIKNNITFNKINQNNMINEL